MRVEPLSPLGEILDCSLIERPSRRSQIAEGLKMTTAQLSARIEDGDGLNREQISILATIIQRDPAMLWELQQDAGGGIESDPFQPHF